MLYIETNSLDQQIELIKFFSCNGEYDAIFWLFPKSKSREICDLKLAPKDLLEGKPVTTYGDGYKPHKTRRVKLTKEFFYKISDSRKSIEKQCDSVVIYKPNEEEWLACAIGHENMCLVRDESLKPELSKFGFKVTSEKPEFW
ncbi:MAG: hypothetical protein KJ630_20835 [Proteobacteria bacterium]|nr:hypothetical protein [Pseudomonadota bacterium]